MVKSILLLLCLIPLCLKAQRVDTLVWNYQNTDYLTEGSLQHYRYEVLKKFTPHALQLVTHIDPVERDLSVFRSTYNYKGGKAFLRCEKIATFCVILVNGKAVLRTNNYFHPWEVEISSYLKKGENIIEARFLPALMMGLEKQYDYIHPAPNDEGEVEIASLVRKPQHMFGWDFAPRMNLLGFIKPVIITQRQALFKNPYVRTLSIDETSAVIERSIEFTGSPAGAITWQINDEIRSFEVLNGKVIWVDTLDNPTVWKAGEINKLYEELWSFTGSEFTAKERVRFGLRKVELVQARDSLGTPFYFKLNNEFVYCKGSNVVPLDVFPEEVNAEKIRNLVFDAKAANMNMLRVWGGGDYLPEYFYQLCDSLGIMVWQDFMFACAMYPSDSAFLKSVENETVYQVKRLSQHPSVVYFNGNNEVNVAWHNWGFQGQEKYNLTESAQQEIEKGYDKLFKALLPKVVADNSDIPYEHTSPLSNWGTPENFNHGTMHYWGVWHGTDSLQEFWKQIGRFNAEFGFQSFPSLYAMSQITAKENWSLNNAAIQARQKSYIGSAKIEAFIQREYGAYSDFTDFVYKSQLVQAKGVGGALIAQRLDAPRCGGSLFWQLNDCWEAPTWSAIDYYGERKALYYLAKTIFDSTTVLRNPNEPQDFYLIQEKSFVPNVVLEYYKYSGEALGRDIIDVVHTEKQKLPVKDYAWDFLIITAREKTYSFVKEGNYKESTLNGEDVTFKTLAYNPQTGRGTLAFDVHKFVANLQFYSEKYPFIFAENFHHYLPGTYSVDFELRDAVEEIVKEDISFHYIQP